MAGRSADKLTAIGGRLLSGAAGSVHLLLSLIYLGPSDLVRRILPPGQTNLVVYIESFGPWWVVMFAASGVVLLAAAIRGHGFIVAHGCAVFVWVLYGAAILIGAKLSQPPSPIITGVVALYVGILHGGIAFVCAERGER